MLRYTQLHTEDIFQYANYLRWKLLLCVTECTCLPPFGFFVLFWDWKLHCGTWKPREQPSWSEKDRQTGIWTGFFPCLCSDISLVFTASCSMSVFRAILHWENLKRRTHKIHLDVHARIVCAGMNCIQLALDRKTVTTEVLHNSPQPLKWNGTGHGCFLPHYFHVIIGNNPLVSLKATHTEVKAFLTERKMTHYKNHRKKSRT